MLRVFFFFFSSRRRHTRCSRDWSSDVCSSDLRRLRGARRRLAQRHVREPGADRLRRAARRRRGADRQVPDDLPPEPRRAARRPARRPRAVSAARSARHADAGPDVAGAATRPAAPDEAPGRQDAPGPWPRGLSREASMRISDVLAALRIEFPAVTNSKLRFLEEQGLVDPLRTPAGYRQYSPADLERLRYVLREQRDRYVPLKVIGERLAALDAGEESEPVSLVVTEDGVPRSGAADARYTTAALAREAGVEEQLV